MTRTTMLDAPNAADMSRSRRLKASTEAVHGRLDSRIMAGAPFRDRERYGRFLRVQYLFHRDIDPGAPAFKGAVDLPTAFWLYVAEGSNLGAAFLFKAAAALGLDASFGARHLAGHPDGRAQHWREFTAALDALELDLEEDARVIAGAEAAFGRVQALVDAAFA